MEWISIGISFISLVISIFAFATSHKASQIAMGESEKSSRDLLSQARRHMDECVKDLSGVQTNKEAADYNETKFKATEHSLKSAVEDWLNAYEEICSKYLDKKIDRKRFKKTYKSEIRGIVESKEDNEFVYRLINPEGTSRFRAIWKVYRQWEHLE